MTSPVAGTVIELVRGGQLDGDMPEIVREVNLRVAQIGGATIPVQVPPPFLPIAPAFDIGDKVRFRPQVRPTYLRGVTGVIYGRLIKTYEVKIDSPTPQMSRFLDSKGCIRSSPALLEKIL